MALRSTLERNEGIVNVGSCSCLKGHSSELQNPLSWLCLLLKILLKERYKYICTFKSKMPIVFPIDTVQIMHLLRTDCQWIDTHLGM